MLFSHVRNLTMSNLANNITIDVAGISKQYLVGGAEQQYDSFREMLMNMLLAPFQKVKTLAGNVSQDRLFWALKDINFEIKSGDIVGVIGHNGAGKSTLLKVLSRITTPTEGKIQLRGQVASLLEVGTGFHPELTGRENIYLNGAILGLQRHQIDTRFDEIVAFADVEKFLDTPVKRYSSGMTVRLAFSVAAHLDTDVLLVDEVLAVGDQKFQQKCLGKLGDASQDGRTILFVSHNLSSIAKLCNRCLVMQDGKIVYDGSVQEGISRYHQQMNERSPLAETEFIGELYPNVKFTDLKINNRPFDHSLLLDPFEKIEVTIDGESKQDISAFKSILAIKRDGHLLFSLYDGPELSFLAKGKFRSTFTIPAKLLYPGEHTLSIGGITDELTNWLWTKDMSFTINHQWSDDYDSTSSVTGLINIAEFGQRINM